VKRQIIGLMGAKGAGKDTAAAFLCKELGFVRLAFAQRLYEEVAEAFGVTVAFLGDRTVVQTAQGPVERKELPQAELALRNCSDPAFVACVLEELKQQNVDMATPLSPREVMQQWGTEYRRRRGVDSYWLDIVQAQLDAEPEQNFVITDVRFPNEHSFVLEFEGLLFRIRNLQVEAREAANRAQNGTSGHSSETALNDAMAHAEIFNEQGNLAKLRADTLAAARAQDLVALS